MDKKLKKSEIGPDKPFWDRSKLLKTVLHLNPEGKAMKPEILANLRERLSSLSRVKRNAATVRKSALTGGREERSTEETLFVFWHLTTMKLHGFWLGNQSWRRAGFGKTFLKLIRFWVSVFMEVVTGVAAAAGEAPYSCRCKEREVKEMRSKREKWVGTCHDVTECSTNALPSAWLGVL